MEYANSQKGNRATYEDVLNAPPHMAAEVIDGVLYTFPRPASPHARAGSGLGAMIGEPFDYGRSGPGGWWILVEPELHHGEDILVPDLAGWLRTRVPKFPNVAFWTIPPDWVCEVLSPSTRHNDLGPKSRIYAREGIPYMWLLDPDDRSLEAFELCAGRWQLIARLIDNHEVSLPPFEAVSAPLGNLWIDSQLPQSRGRHPRVHDEENAAADPI